MEDPNVNRAKWKTLLYVLKAHDSTGSIRVGFVRGSVWSVLPAWSAGGKMPPPNSQVVTYTPPKPDNVITINQASIDPAVVDLFLAKAKLDDRAKRGWLR